MAPFATVPDLGDVASESDALMALASASTAIVSALGWDPRESVRTLTVEGAPYIFLPALNVTAVAVVADGLTVAAGDFAWTTNGRVTLLRYWHRLAASVTVTYTAGFPDSEVGLTLTAVCVEQAKKYLDASNGLRSKTWSLGAESESETYFDRASDLSTDPRLSMYALAPAVA